MRALLVALIVAATAAFVVGVAIERGSDTGHVEAAVEEHGAEAPAAEEPKEELRPLGIDVEAWPFVVLAAAASLGLAAAAAVRPQPRVLALTAVAMLAFAALDVREAFHQQDLGETGLAVLAGVVAALHAAAAAVAFGQAARPPARINAGGEIWPAA